MNFLLLRRSLQTALLILSTHFAALPAAAQTVVVTGIREPMAADRLVADVTVIDSETLRFTLADSLADLLRREAGVQISRSGGPGQSSGLLIRGASSQQSVVLVDGVRVGSATLGYAALEALGLAQVERVEVLRGPGSSLYGADAVGGVVNLITRRGQGAPSFDGRVALGGYGSREASVGVRGAQGAIDYAAVVSNERSRGVSALRANDQFGNFNPDRDGFTRRSAQAQLGLQPAAGQRLSLRLAASKLDAQYDASEFLPPSFAQDSSADFRNRLDTRLVAAEHQARWSQQWATQLLLSDTDEDLASGGRQTDRFRTQRRQALAQATWTPMAGQQLVLGLERVNERAQSSSYAADAERRNDALLLAYSASAGRWSAQVDLRHDDNSAYGGVDSGRVGASFALSPRWRLRALAGTTFRAPSFNDLVFPGYGVATIRPEHGRSIEAGVNGSVDGAELSATVWRNRVRDLIGYEPDFNRCPPGPAYAFGCASNIGSAQLQGLTLAAAQRWGGFALRGTVDLLDAKDRATGARLARRAAHQESVDASWQRGPLSFGAALLRLGARPDGGKMLAAETTLDLRAGWRFAPQWQLQAKLLNATDRDVEPVRDYQGLGRQAWLVLRWDGGL